VLYEILGQVYFTQKNYAKAEESYRKSLSLDGNRMETYNLLGELYVAQNSVDKAIGEFENGLKLDPKSISLHTIVGMLMESRNMKDKAELHYREAIKLDPQTPVANNNLAWLLAESGVKLDEALRLAQTADEKMPNNPNVKDTMGWIYYKKGAYQLAADLFEQLTMKVPDRSVYQYHLGLSYYKMGDRDKARSALGQALRLDPAFSGAQDAKNILATLASR
jgi:tetratricopeptide (TPR) repeat protein